MIIRALCKNGRTPLHLRAMRQGEIVPTWDDLPRNSCGFNFMHRRSVADFLDLRYHRAVFPTMDVCHLPASAEKAAAKIS